MSKTDLSKEPKQKYVPLRAFRFMLDFGIEGLDYWRVKTVTYSEGKLFVCVRETEDLYHPEFFQNKKFKNRTVKLKFLDAAGVAVVETTFSGVSFKKYETGSFDYDDDSNMMTDLFFTYKKVEHHTLCHNQQEEKNILQ